MTVINSKTSYDFNFGGFNSVVPPTSETLHSYMSHVIIDADGRVSDDGLVRHENFAFEVRLIETSYDVELAGASPRRRKRITRERDSQVALFWQRGLHKLEELDVKSSKGD